MRARILVPILVLLVVFCGVLGFSVYSNISNATAELINKQLDNTLEVVENDLIKVKNSSSSLYEVHYQDIVEGFGVADGGVIVVDRNGLIIADSKQAMIGQSVEGEEWLQKARSDLNSEFNAVFGQTEVFAHSVMFDDMLIVSYLSSSAVNELFETPLYVIGVVGIISVVVVAILIYFLITRLILNPVESLDVQIEELEKGEPIDLKPLKLCPEIVSSATQLNTMLELYKSREAHRQESLEEAERASEVDKITSFEFVSLLRAVFELHRESVVEKKLKFSLLVNNDMPEIVRADYEQVFADISKLLGTAFSQADIGAKVEAHVAPAPTPSSSGDSEDVQDKNTKNMDIVFEVHYNGREDIIDLAVKRG